MAVRLADNQDYRTPTTLRLDSWHYQLALVAYGPIWFEKPSKKVVCAPGFKSHKTTNFHWCGDDAVAGAFQSIEGGEFHQGLRERQEHRDRRGCQGTAAQQLGGCPRFRWACRQETLEIRAVFIVTRSASIKHQSINGHKLLIGLRSEIFI